MYDFFCHVRKLQVQCISCSPEHTPQPFIVSQIATLLPCWEYYLSGWVVGEDKTLFLAQLQREKLSGTDKVLAWLFLILHESPLHLSNAFSFFRQALHSVILRLLLKKHACCHESLCQGAARSSHAIRKKQWETKHDEAAGSHDSKDQVPQYLSEVTRQWWQHLA